MRFLIFLFISLSSLLQVSAQPQFNNAGLTDSEYIVSNEDRFGQLDLLITASEYSIYGAKLSEYKETCGRTGIISSPQVKVVLPGHVSLDQKKAETIAKQAKITLRI